MQCHDNDVIAKSSNHSVVNLYYRPDTQIEAEAQDEMLMNDLSGVCSKGKRKFNTVADDEKNKKHISDIFKNEKKDMDFVGGLDLIIRVKVNSNVWNKTYLTISTTFHVVSILCKFSIKSSS